MAEKSGFFNALKVDNSYDRTYNANDYSDNLAVIISSGVLRSANDDLKVTASGLVATVAAGRAWINGHYYKNTTPLSLAAVVAPVGGSRIDRVMLRFDNTIQQRRIYIEYVEGTASNNPVPPAPTRNEYIYDLVLADLLITANATGMTVTDQRGNPSVCGWVYSVSGDNSFFTTLDNSFYEWFNDTKDTLASVTLFKRYKWRTVLQAATNTVQFDIPQFDEDTCFVEVYVNGILDTEGVEYERNGNVLTGLGLPLVAGTEVEVNCYKSIDGTGIMTVADEITALQNAVAQLDGVSRLTYKCTGTNDNISLSQIATAIKAGQYDENNVTAAAKAFLENLGGNEWLLDLNHDAQITIEVSGYCGVSTAFAGAGTSVSPYRWFSFGTDAQGESKKITFDFAKCNDVTVICTGATTNTIFYGSNVNLKNATVSAIFYTDNNTNIQMIECNGNKMDSVNVDDCIFTIRTSGTARIADHGTFTNCKCDITSDGAAAYCFKPESATFIRLIGGSYKAYGKTSTGISSAIFHTSASETDAVAMAYNIHCPVITVENYSQGFLSVANAGKTYINGVVSRLTSSGDYNEIIGLVNKNKA